MRIVVLGAGAMGCLFGGLLRLAGHQVTLVDIWAEH
ncbi:MAG TPA: 2-dehydropantoate 2-reductase N-terminal domain-containing protein, partial [Thermoleophilia bacterium]|nr:2-dehydropantoate 2-reductase N-terminal domain-containing protein [Thermoleophilia bacterium]